MHVPGQSTSPRLECPSEGFRLHGRTTAACRSRVDTAHRHLSSATHRDPLTDINLRRNRRVAEAYTRAFVAGRPRSFEDLESELLNGQKLQGVLTSNEVQEVLRVHDWEVRSVTNFVQVWPRSGFRSQNH